MIYTINLIITIIKVKENTYVNYESSLLLNIGINSTFEWIVTENEENDSSFKI